MKKVSIIIMLTALAWCSATAQETSSAKKEDGKKKTVTVKPYGFVRNYFNLDTRKTYTVIGGEYNMIPYDEKMESGVDVNDVAHAQLQALTTRIGLNLEGPELLGMQSSGKIEADFGGFGTNNTVLRIRQAYVKLSSASESWNGELLVGQTWHPLSGDIMPEVLGMAAGAPFRPHSRTPQVRAIQYFGSFGYTAALLYQLQYMNNGPVWDATKNDYVSSNSTDFALNALVPEAFLGFNFKKGPWYAQLGADVQMLRPRTHAKVAGTTKKVDETVTSFTPTLYAQYVGGMWSVKFRTLLAQNTSHLNQLCGYAVTGVNADGSWNYAPIRNTISYLNIAYGKKVRCNLFLGYMKNLGAGEDLYDFGTGNYRIYMKGGTNFTNLNSIYRIAPSISYNVKAFNIGLEYEWTACTYGDIATDGSIKNNDNLHQVANHRICALVKYNF